MACLAVHDLAQYIWASPAEQHCQSHKVNELHSQQYLDGQTELIGHVETRDLLLGIKLYLRRTASIGFVLEKDKLERIRE